MTDAIVTAVGSTEGDAVLRYRSGTIDTQRLLGLMLRLVVFSAVVWNVYSVRYLPYRNQAVDDADTEAAVRAINAGHPFELLDIGADGKPQFRPMSDATIDRGMQVVMAVGAAIGQQISDRRFSSRHRTSGKCSSDCLSSRWRRWLPRPYPCW